MKTIYITHSVFALHEMGAHHPETPLRLEAIESRLQEERVSQLLRVIPALKAS